MSKVKIPTFETFMNPLLRVLQNLGGSGTIEEINTKTAEMIHLSDEQLGVLHDAEKDGRTEFEYRLAWARTYLKKFGLLENSSRGVWSLTPKARELDKVDEKEVVRFYREHAKMDRADAATDNLSEEAAPDWQQDLWSTLLKIKPAAVERLVQSILRESGFSQVEVTGRSGDGGVDGRGIMRIGGLLSFHVIFQCKR